MNTDRIRELRNQIIKAKQAYYYGGRPILSDEQYDALEDKLRELNPSDPLLATVGAPVPPNNILSKATHRMPMGSQNKVNSAAEFMTWYQKSAEGGAVVVSLKGDGASAAAYYSDGKLVQAISRGDGLVGEDITANAVKFKGLPVYTADEFGAFTGAVRFEAILTVEDWGIVDPERRKNPRNAGSGIMGRKNGEQSELLTCYAFDIDDTRPGRTLQSEIHKFERLGALGFNVIDHQRCTAPEQVVAYFERVREGRDALPIWIDGIVIRVDDIALQSRLGVTANRPKGQVAWKFDSKGAETTLLSYSISVGHTGALIPTAQLEPVEIGGTTVASALLNNWDEIERLGVAVGDRVWLIKANDIIPKIVSRVEAAANRVPIPVPTHCPVCQAAVARRKNTGGGEGVIIECTNPECDAKAAGKIKRWVKALDLQGLGDSVREALVAQLALEDAADLYRLKDNPDALAALIITPEKGLRLGKKRAAVILDAIEARRTLTLVEFLGSLGIDRLGQRRVELMITQANGALDKLEDWTSGKLRDADFAAKVGVPGVGAALQESIDKFAPVIKKLLVAGVHIDGTGVRITPPTESGAKTVCISGKLPSGKKKQDYAVPLLAAGIQLVDTVNKELTYLVVASSDSESSKTTKARKLGVQVISEDELNALIAGDFS
jgi:DNA ligase (NAD+)